MFKKDVASAILKAVVSTVAFEDVSRYLPFQTRVVSGSHFNHIQSQTAYDITTYGKRAADDSPFFTATYIVSEGDTLCRKTGWIAVGGFMREDCPGCLAIAQGIIKRDIEQDSLSHRHPQPATVTPSRTTRRRRQSNA